jgi:phage protein U
MNNALLGLGAEDGRSSFTFYATAPSFNTLRSTLEPRWSESERLARSPAGQFIGAQNATVDLTGIIYPDVFGSREMIDQMNAAANAGTIFTVVGMAPGDLTGFAAGRWYIRSIQNERSYFGPNGAQKIDFQITLRAYGEDNQAAGGRLFK